jgi:hypothetical protein
MSMEPEKKQLEAVCAKFLVTVPHINLESKDCLSADAFSITRCEIKRPRIGRPKTFAVVPGYKLDVGIDGDVVDLLESSSFAEIVCCLLKTWIADQAKHYLFALNVGGEFVEPKLPVT